MHPEAATTWRLGHRPELDAVRGIAIALVVLSHLTPEGSAGRIPGLVGVIVFFTLSGFLITSLLLEQHEQHGRVDLRRFYRARAYRLAPAMLSMVAFVVATNLLWEPIAPTSLVVGTLTWTSNWVIATGGHSGTALTHTWSLAIEEQFYLLWPLVIIVVARRRRLLLAATVTGVCVPVLLRFLLAASGTDRIMNGTDTRADSLLVGCLLAVLVHGRPEGRSEPVAAAGCLVAVLASCLMGVIPIVVLAPLLVAVATAGAIHWSARGDGVRWLRARPLTLLGKRSYGLYLWHWPIIVVVDRLLHRDGGLLVAVVVLPLAALVTEASWQFVEQPFLRRRHGTRARDPRPIPEPAAVASP
ncbi:MAG: acyltransferase [Nocardioidaceae bacterium]|nr:acyltransferase [Nocardioidaceae bacterium]NUS52267.1 acyltransferase [Nocardioidaceae bacterium]